MRQNITWAEEIMEPALKEDNERRFLKAPVNPRSFIVSSFPNSFLWVELMSSLALKFLPVFWICFQLHRGPSLAHFLFPAISLGLKIGISELHI